MSKRNYNQYCALARALDLVGERWTLLLVRELLISPRRFGDLLDALSGIGTNLLSARLRELTEAGIIRLHSLKGPGRGRAYELTEVGHSLEAAVVALARWGFQFLGAHRCEDHWSPEWNAIALKYAFQPSGSLGIDETYEVCVDGKTVQAHVVESRVETALGRKWEPHVILATDAGTFLKLATGKLDIDSAIRRGTLSVSGSRRALKRFSKLFVTAPK